MKKRSTIFIFAIVSILAASLLILVNTPIWKSEEFRVKMGWPSYGREDHRTYHDCQWHRDVIIADAKKRFAESAGLRKGAPVTWQDLVPFITNGTYYANTRYPGTAPDYLPKCPSGGTYSINPIGTNPTCSHPYHQWYNCMRRGGIPPIGE